MNVMPLRNTARQQYTFNAIEIDLPFLLLSITQLLSAQNEEEPVQWTTQLNRISETVVELEFNASIAEKWHLYSLEEFEEGPLPTEFVFVYDSLQLALAGPTTSGSPKVEFDQIFQIDLPFFDKEAVFKQQFKLLNAAAKEISGEINYQACDDRVCIFRTESFRIALDGTALQQAEIELTEQDKARSAALTLNLKNREYLEDQLNASGSDSPYWNLFFSVSSGD